MRRRRRSTDALHGHALEDQARLLARGTWLVFDANRDLFLVMTRETTNRPKTCTHAADGWPGDGPALVASWLDRHNAVGTLTVADTRAMAVVLLDALTFYWLQGNTESPQPYGIDDNRFIDAWVQLITALRT